MAQQYIGSRISLISKSDIRYRGVLHSIDPAASTVSLEQVRSMGTEGRKTDPADEIAPTDTLYEFIVFRAADVKDLSIEAPAEPKPEPPKPSVPDDPAIMSTTAPPRPIPGQPPFMPPHMMQPSQGLYNGTMPPMMYPPAQMPSQWGPYFPPPPGQAAPMMGYPPHQAPPNMVARPAQTVSSSAQSPPKPVIAPVSGISAKLPAPASNVPLAASPVHPKAAAPLPSASPTKQLSSTAAPGGLNSVPPIAGLKVAQAADSSKAPVSSRPNGAPPTKGIFGAPTAMDMMAAVVANGSSASAHQNNGKASLQLNHQLPPNSTSKSSQSTSAHPPPSRKESAPSNYQTHNTANPPGSNFPRPHASQQQSMMHPLPQAPARAKAHVKAQAGPNESSKAHQQASSTPALIVPAQDFDFASANAKFTKAAPPHKSAETATNGRPEETKPSGEDVLNAATEGLSLKQKVEDDVFIPEAPPGTYYDKKKSFFDDISSEVKERSATTQDSGRGSTAGVGRAVGGRGASRGRGSRGWDRNAERQKNLDTFGEVALSPNLGALGSGYNGYGRGGMHRILSSGGVNGYRSGRGRGHSRGAGRGGASHGSDNAGMRMGSGPHMVPTSSNSLPYHR